MNTQNSELERLEAERVQLLAKMDSGQTWTKADDDRAEYVGKRIVQLNEVMSKAAEATRLLASIGGGVEKTGPSADDGGAAFDSGLTRKGMPNPIRSAAALSRFTAATAKAFRDSDPMVGGISKALVPNGAITIDYSGHIALEPQAQLFIASAIPTTGVDVPQGAYLRQTQRDNQASDVPLGVDKPVSKYAFEAVNWKVSTVAHLSEPIERSWVNDFTGLLPALSSEMGYGLAVALDSLILNGGKAEDGTTMPGLLTMSGVLATAAQADPLKSLRWGIYDLESAGVTPTVIVLNPADWRDIDLLREDGASGKYLLGDAPQGRPIRQAWGVPVVLANAMPVGESLIFDANATALASREGVTLAWTEQGTYTEGTGENAVTRDLFGSNRLRFRAEGRWGLVVSQPHAITHVQLIQ